MNIVAYGGGTDSTAMLIEFVDREIDVDLILFADTGAEKPHTYRYIEMFSEWLVDNEMPKITIIKNKQKSKIAGLEALCLKNKTLPSIAYGFKSCSVQFKIEPVDKFLKDNFKYDWDNNNIIKIIGYDADEHQRAKDSPNEHYKNEFPLIDWNMGRDECIKTIQDAGLRLPGKSACFFCPSSKPTEIRQLAKNYPDLIERALKMEKQAELTTIKGLGRGFAWANLLAQSEMFDEDCSHTPEMVCGCYDG